MKDYVVVYVIGGKTYTHIKQAAEQYEMSVQSLYRILNKIETLDRYAGVNVFRTSNDSGDRMVNTLVLEDFLHYRAQIEAGIKGIPPYDPALVRWNRGEYKTPLLSMETAM